MFLTRGFAQRIYYIILISSVYDDNHDNMMTIMIMSPPPSTPSSSQPYRPQTKPILGTNGRGLQALELDMGEQRQAGQLRVQGQRQETSMTADQNRVNRGFIPSPPNTAQANRARKTQERKLARLREREQKQALRDQEDERRRRDRQARDESAAQALLRYEARKAQEEEQRQVFVIQQEAKKTQESEERKLAKLREREQKQALRDQQDEQRRRDRQARDESAMQALLRHKAIAEEKKAQDAENYRLREEQKLAMQRAREQKQLLRDQQDEQRRLDRQARDEACMQALLRYEAATKEKRAQESEERELAKLRERERKHVLRDQQDGQGQMEGQKQVPKAKPCIDRDSQRLAATEIEERKAIWNEQELVRHRDREQRDEAGTRALQRHKATVQAQRVQQKSLTEGRVVAYDGPIPSFLIRSISI
jgi:hypothetical protein